MTSIAYVIYSGGAPLNLASEPSKQVKEEEIQEIPSLCEHCQGNVFVNVLLLSRFVHLLVQCLYTKRSVCIAFPHGYSFGFSVI